MSAWYRRGPCSARQDVLDFVEWVFGLQRREEERLARPDFPRETSWAQMGFDAVVMTPGDVEPPDAFHDEVLPEYVGLLDAQLYWPGLPPGICLACTPARRSGR